MKMLPFGDKWFVRAEWMPKRFWDEPAWAVGKIVHLNGDDYRVLRYLMNPHGFMVTESWRPADSKENR